MKLKGRFSKESFWFKIFVMLCVLLVMLIVSALLITIYNLLFQSVQTQENLIKGSMFIQTIGLFIVPAYLMAYLFSKTPGDYLNMKKAPSVTGVLGVIVCMVSAIPFLNAVIAWNEAIHLPGFLSGVEEWMRTQEDTAQELTKRLLDIHSIGNLIITMIIVGVLTGMGEEMMFRGILQRILWEKSQNVHMAVWVGAIVFSAIHFQFYGFFPRMLLGAFFGYLLVWSRNIWLPIIGHFFNNSMATVTAYLENNGYGIGRMEKIGTTEDHTLWAAGLSLVAFAILLQLFYRMCKTQKAY